MNDNETKLSSLCPDSTQAAANDLLCESKTENLIDIEQFFKIELKVGEVIAAESVPKSKKLLKLKISFGEQMSTRQVLSGIAQFYSPESLIGKRVIVVSNLKPAKMMGLESQGMILAGSDEGNTVLSIIEPSAELPLGAVIR